MTKEELKKISDKYGKGIFTCRGEPSPEFVDAAHTVVKLLDYIKELKTSLIPRICKCGQEKLCPMCGV